MDILRIVYTVALLIADAPDTSKVNVKQQDDVTLRAIAEGYQANRERFGFLTCRYSLRQGMAKSLNDALEGSFESSLDAAGLWIVDGPNVRFELRVLTEVALPRAEDAVVKGAATHEASVGLLSKVTLDNGLYQLRLSPELSSGSVFSPDFPARGIELTPFDLGVMGADESLSPPALIMSALRGQGFCRLVDSREGERYEMTFGDSPDSVGLQFVLDASRGFFPNEIASINQATGEVVSKVFVTETVLCTNGAWAPKRAITVWNPDEAPPFAVREFIVRELNVEERPSKNDFAVQVTEGTSISDPARPGPAGRLVASRTIGLEDLEKLRAQINSVAFGDQRFAPPPSETRRRWLFVLFSAGGLLVLALFWAARGRRRATRGSSRGETTQRPR